MARTWHRRLVPIAFLPLLIWSIGGLASAWHGIFASPESGFVDDTPAENLKQENFLVPITPITRNSRLSMIKEIRVGKLLNIPVYRLIMDLSHAETYDAITGEQLSPLDKTSAIAVAKSTFKKDVIIKAVTRVDSWSADYTGPIPAWRISIASMTDMVIFVGLNTCEITARKSMFSPLVDFFMAGQDTRGKTQTALWVQGLFSLVAIGAINYGMYLWSATVLGGSRKSRTRKRRSARR